MHMPRRQRSGPGNAIILLILNCWLRNTFLLLDPHCDVGITPWDKEHLCCTPISWLLNRDPTGRDKGSAKNTTINSLFITRETRLEQSTVTMGWLRMCGALTLGTSLSFLVGKAPHRTKWVACRSASSFFYTLS